MCGKWTWESIAHFGCIKSEVDFRCPGSWTYKSGVQMRSLGIISIEIILRALELDENTQEEGLLFNFLFY